MSYLYNDNRQEYLEQEWSCVLIALKIFPAKRICVCTPSLQFNLPKQYLWLTLDVLPVCWFPPNVCMLKPTAKIVPLRGSTTQDYAIGYGYRK